MARTNASRLLWGFVAGAILGCCWLIGDSLLGPSASFVLVPLVARQDKWLGRFVMALGYYAAGSAPVAAAVIGYWGAGYTMLGVAAWLGSSLVLSAPWAVAARWPGVLAALELTALPPLGVIGWLSPLNAAGVLFPGLGWIGLCLLCFGFAAIYCRAHGSQVAILTAVGIVSIACNLAYVEPPPPAGWMGIDTRLAPSRGDPFMAIQNNRQGINAGITLGSGARVIVFPEAILDDWYPGTQQQFGMAAPSDQVWILGADTDSTDAVVRVSLGHADAEPVARSAGLILGGNWLPWSNQGLRPAWWQRAFVIEGRRVWAALCVEQLQPWTWLEAMSQRPEVVLAMSNSWWARGTGTISQRAGAAGLTIERASSRAWARLMQVPVVWGENR